VAQLDQLHTRIAQLPAQLTCDDSDAADELRIELHELIIKLKVRPAGTKGRVWDRACLLLRQLEEKAPCGHPECSSVATSAEGAASRRVVGLTAAGPASLGYERIDAGGHLTRLAKPEDYPDWSSPGFPDMSGVLIRPR
jgi:hypothetical protein